MPVRVQPQDFDAGAEIAALRAGDARVGAVAAFVGTVRDVNDGDGVSTLTLEHYPGMTERALEEIVAKARERWDVLECLVVHRVGELRPLDQIVLVVVTSAHRGEAFAACRKLIDEIKHRVPIWKREHGPEGAYWVGWVDARCGHGDH